MCENASISDFIVFLSSTHLQIFFEDKTLGGSCYRFYVGLNTVSYYYDYRLWIGLTQSYIPKTLATSDLYHKP